MTDTTPPSSRRVPLSFPPAERVGAVASLHHLPDEGRCVLNVHFVGARPANELIDRVLRDCLDVAVAVEGGNDIDAHAWRLTDAAGGTGSARVLNPYGRGHRLCFDARLRRVGVRGTEGDRFIDPTPAARPECEDGAEDLDALDDATSDLAGAVERHIWYGYDSPEAIDARIDRLGTEGPACDVEWLKAFAARTFARKRAAEAAWPEDTDCDALDRVLGGLHDRGIYAMQWAGDTLQEGLEAVSTAINADDFPEDRYSGYCFFHSQDIDRALIGEGLMLAYGPFDSAEPGDFVRVGRVVCDALEEEGFEVEWDGTANARIDLPQLLWRQRSPH